MSNRRLEVFHYRQALLQMQQGLSDRAIALGGTIGRRKAAQLRGRALSEGWFEAGAKLPDDAALAAIFIAPKQSVSGPESSLESHRDRVRQWIDSGINARVIHRALEESHGYTGSYSSVCRMIRSIKKTTPTITTVLEFKPGESAQIDFGKGPEIIDHNTGEVMKAWFFVMVLSWSRHQYAELVTDQSIETWLGCHRRAFEHFNGVPASCMVDNLKAAITKACYYDPQVQHAYADCAEGYGFMIAPCPVADPKKKGRVESAVKYVKNNFVPLRTFRSLADANTQLMQWVMEVAGLRVHGTTYEAPLRCFEQTERALLKPLPTTPPELATWAEAKLHGDCHLQVQKCRYSAPYKLVSKSLDVRLSETSVRVYHKHELVAVHPRLSRPGERSTLDEHLPPEHIAYKMRDPVWCRKQADAVGPYRRAMIDRLFACGVLSRLRAAQGVVKLTDCYEPSRVEAACKQALAFDDISYRSVKSILHKRLDQVADPEGALNMLGDAYTGKARYGRDTRDLFDSP
jgi:transposase